MQRAPEDSPVSEGEEVEEDSESSYEHGKTGRKLGDLLFSSVSQQVSRVDELKELLSRVKGKAAKKALLDKEAPELQGLMEELELALTLLICQVEPLLAKPDLRQHNKALATFVELKRNLLLNYCSFLAFYLLLKLDGTKSEDDVRAHPVLFKLTALKQTLDGLAPLDAKLEKALRVRHLAPPVHA